MLEFQNTCTTVNKKTDDERLFTRVHIHDVKRSRLACPCKN